jgi:hypothetical protein
MSHELRLYKDELAPAAVLPVNTQGVTAVYVVSGGLRVRAGHFSGTLGANSAFHSPDAAHMAAGNLATVVLRWQLVRAGAADDIATGDGVASTLLLNASMSLDATKDYLLRCDRVDFPPGGEALTHTHRGGGTRCLLFGGIEIHTNNTVHRYLPLEPWFEAGPDPVYAKASATEASGFARVMILPRELLGKSSISYVNAEDLNKPKNQKYQVFIDAPIALPA